MSDRIEVRADDVDGVSEAGLLVAGTLARRLGLGQLLREHLTVPGSAGANPDRKCLTVIHSLLAGGDCIDDVDALRAGSTVAVLGHGVAAPSTVGTFLRSFGFNHARQLDAVTRRLLVRAVAVGAYPEFAEQVTVDIDSTPCETYGLGKDGAREVMRTGRRGYHPLLAVLAGTGDSRTPGYGVAARTTPPRRRCSSKRPSVGSGGRAPRVRSCSARTPGSTSTTSSPLAGPWTCGSLSAPACSGTCGQRSKVSRRRPGNRSTTFCPEPRSRRSPEPVHPRPVGTPPRRCGAGAANRATHPAHRRPDKEPSQQPRPGPQQDTLFPIFDYHPIITDRDGDLFDVESDHRRHAEVELTIRDLKHDMGLAHFPTKSFGGNAAWLILNTIAHNLTRWTARLGLDLGHVMTKKIRRHIYTVAGRIVRTGRQLILRLPRSWPWAGLIIAGLDRLRALPAASG